MQDKLTNKLRRRIIENTLLSILAYSIAISIGFVSIYFGLSYYGYLPFLILSVSSTFLNLIFLLITYLQKNISSIFASRMLFAQIAVWFVTFTFALFFMAEIRSIILLMSIMAITFVFSYQTLKTSVYITLVIATIYLVTSYIGIFHFGQPGSFVFDFLSVSCYIPASIFIAYMADRVAKQRNLLKASKFKLEKSNDERQKMLQKLEVVAATDDLTGLMNRRAINLQLSIEFERSKRQNTSVSILLLDIDFFKNVNDKFGHDCGDEVLKQFCEILNEKCREIDYLSRWGGEEFLILLPDTKSIYAKKNIAERIRSAVSESEFKYKEHTIRITVSIGLHELDYHQSLQENLLNVDECLYKAKETGRNRVIGQFNLDE